MAFVLSLTLMLASIGLLFTKGLSFGIDFTGGIVMEVRGEQKLEIAEVRSLLSGHPELGSVDLQYIGNEGDLMIRIQGKDKDQASTINSVKSLLEGKFGNNLQYRKTEYVGPQVGKELIQAGILSLVLSCLGIMAYVWVRFEWQYAVGAISSLVHDLLLTLGLYSLMGLEFNLTSIAALLTILGYSINDTVVVYDRIRESLRKYKKMPLEIVLNNSVNETLSRTIMTSGTTLLALAALIAVGGEVIQGFSLALFFGVVVGTYSSIYAAAPMLMYMNLRKTALPQAA